MKKMIRRSGEKRFLSLLLCVLMMTALLPALNTRAEAAGNPYPYWQTFWVNGREYTTITCTYYAWQQVYDRLGIALPAWGNAGTWLDYARNAGYETGTTPRVNSLIVWTGGQWGHVGFVTAVNGNYVTYNEGGTANSRANSIGIFEGHTIPDGYTDSPAGYIYLTPATPQNLGDDFYAYIILANPGKHIENSSGNVQIAANGNDSNDPRQIWHFTRQSNGSYMIVNEYDGKCLDAADAGTVNGTNIWMYPNHDHAAQRWFVYTHPSGSGFMLAPSHASNLVMDAAGGATANGTNIQLWEVNSTDAQKFSIYKLTLDGRDYPKLKPSAPKAPTNIIYSQKTVSWTASPLQPPYDMRAYDVWIYSGYSAAGTPSYTGTNITGTSCTVNLNSGTYTAKIRAKNTRYAGLYTDATSTFTVAPEKEVLSFTKSNVTTDAIKLLRWQGMDAASTGEPRTRGYDPTQTSDTVGIRLNGAPMAYSTANLAKA
ncbi:MAG: RICIN domain-containing protein, partial [Clostridia bacterium]|nr:RICIN domain-containing protein [Clostridia bacterium]